MAGQCNQQTLIWRDVVNSILNTKSKPASRTFTAYDGFAYIYSFMTVIPSHYGENTNIGSLYFKQIPVAVLVKDCIPCIILLKPSKSLADPGESKGCSTNTFVIH